MLGCFGLRCAALLSTYYQCVLTAHLLPMQLVTFKCNVSRCTLDPNLSLWHTVTTWTLFYLGGVDSCSLRLLTLPAINYDVIISTPDTRLSHFMNRILLNDTELSPSIYQTKTNSVCPQHTKRRMLGSRLLIIKSSVLYTL